MPSPSRLHYGTYYHIYNRGNNRENIFIEHRNYEYFIKLYKKYIRPVADTYAYCLLRNHFHFLLRIKTEEELSDSLKYPSTRNKQGSINPSQGFANLFNAYAKAFNKVYVRTGSLFQHPFGRIRITSDAHLIYLIIYIHRNPQQRGLTKNFSDWHYSSYPDLYSQKRTFLQVGTVLSWFYGRENFISHHNELELTSDLYYLISDDEF